MRRITDAQQAGTIPGAQPVDADREQLYVVPCLQLVHAIGKERQGCGDPLPERRQTLLLDVLGGVLGNDIGELEVVAAVEYGEEAARVEAPPARRVARTTRDAHPKNIDRGADILDLEPCLGA